MRKQVLGQEFTEAMLPKTRREQLLHCLKHHKLLLLSLSLLMILFLLPLAVDYLFFSQMIVAASYNNVSKNELFSLVFYFGVLSIPCFVILYVGYAGMFEALKHIVYADGMFASSTFFLGIKANWKKAIPLGILLGISFFGLVVGSDALLTYAQVDSWMVYGAIVVLSLIFFFLTVTSFYMLAEASSYENGWMGLLKNGFIFARIRFPMNLVLFLLFPGANLLLFFAGDIPMYVGMGLTALLSSFFLLLWNLWIYRTFDVFINKEHFPSYYRKGLAKEETIVQEGN